MRQLSRYCLLLSFAFLAGCGFIGMAFAPLDAAIRPDASDVRAVYLGVPEQQLELIRTTRSVLHEKLGPPVNTPPVGLDIEFYASVRFEDPVGSAQNRLIPGSGDKLDRVTYDLAVVSFEEDVIVSIDIVRQRDGMTEISGCWNAGYCVEADIEHGFKVGESIIYPVLVHERELFGQNPANSAPRPDRCEVFVYGQPGSENIVSSYEQFLIASPGDGTRIVAVGHFAHLLEPPGRKTVRINPLNRQQKGSSVREEEDSDRWDAEESFQCAAGERVYVKFHYDDSLLLRSRDRFSVMREDENVGKRTISERSRLL